MSALKPGRQAAAFGLVVLLAACGASGGEGGLHPLPETVVVPEGPYLSRAHAHNDYQQPNPLFGALGRGFASIEVDVVLQNGELYVAHAPEEVDEGVTLRGAYLDPLREAHGSFRSLHGQDRPPLQLMVDVKTDADETYALLHDVLQDYSPMLTTWEADRRTPGAVAVVISGNRPSANRLEAEATRYAALDGRILDDREAVSPEVMPLVSADWEKLGPPDPDARLGRAGRVIEQMHAEGRKVRFWATPEDEDLWRALLAMGVDYIGTDQPLRLERLLLELDDGESHAID